MDKFVTVQAHPETGDAVTPSKNNPEWGTIRVKALVQVARQTKGGGVIFDVEERHAFVNGKLSAFAAAGIQVGTQLPGTVAVCESFDAFYKDQTPKFYPEDHENAGDPVEVHGRSVYRLNVYDMNCTMKDEYLNAQTLAQAASEVDDRQQLA
jgi:hypothetical protein